MLSCGVPTLTKIYSQISENENFPETITNFIDDYLRTPRFPNISYITMEFILEYLRHHKGRVPAEIAQPIRSVKMERIVEDRWDAQFINMRRFFHLFFFFLRSIDCSELTFFFKSDTV